MLQYEKELDDFIAFLREDEKSKNTIFKYKNNILSFLKYLGKKSLNKNIVIDFKDKLDNINEYLPNTTNNYLVSINKFLKFINREDCCVKIIKQQKKFSAKNSIDYTDYHRLLRISLKHNMEQHYIISRILGETGIRISELKFFTIENLDKTMTIKNKGKVRKITVHIELLNYIKKYCKKNNIIEGYIIFNPKTKNIYADSTIWRKLKKIAGLARVNKEKIHPHAFRKYFAKQYLDMYPNDIAGLADILGHNSLETTRIYTKLTDDETEKKVRKVKF